jgi:uncharacterized protein YndB with AHSA1/START domain
MTDELTIRRTFPAPQELVFEFVTRRDRVMSWWGPEGMSVRDAELDFSAPGPWQSVMVNAEGKRFKVSGRVVTVAAPHTLEFTWGWHDDRDERGPESLVRIELRAADRNTEFVLTHRGLPDEASRENHRLGWTSTLAKLERLLA